VEAVANFLRQLRPDLNIVALRYALPDPRTLEGLRRSDLIVTTTNRTMPRLAAALLASAYLRVHLDISSGIFALPTGLQRGAATRLLLPGDACACCRERMRQLEEAREELDFPFAEARPRHRPRWSEERAGSLISVNAAGVSCAMQLWLDFLAGRLASSTWLRLEWEEDGRLTASRIEQSGEQSCPVCQACGQGDFRFSAFFSSVTGVVDGRT
jgi:hypothetical protein